jgi:hypothetical protein
MQVDFAQFSAGFMHWRSLIAAAFNVLPIIRKLYFTTVSATQPLGLFPGVKKAAVAAFTGTRAQ